MTLTKNPAGGCICYVTLKCAHILFGRKNWKKRKKRKEKIKKKTKQNKRRTKNKKKRNEKKRKNKKRREKRNAKKRKRKKTEIANVVKFSNGFGDFIPYINKTLTLICTLS